MVCALDFLLKASSLPFQELTFRTIFLLYVVFLFLIFLVHRQANNITASGILKSLAQGGSYCINLLQ